MSCYLLSIVPGSTRRHVLSYVVDVPGGVDGEVVRETHQVHHLPDIEVPGSSGSQDVRSEDQEGKDMKVRKARGQKVSSSGSLGPVLHRMYGGDHTLPDESVPAVMAHEPRGVVPVTQLLADLHLDVLEELYEGPAGLAPPFCGLAVEGLRGIVSLQPADAVI